MWFRSSNAWKVEGASTVTRMCPRCHNTNEHELYVEPFGPALQFIWMKKPLLSAKRYFLTCPVCQERGIRLTKEQVRALMKGH